MAVVHEFQKSVVTKQIAKKLEEKFDPLADQFQQLIQKHKGSPTCDDAKQVLKSIINEDDGFDETINNLSQATNAMFCIAANYLVARTLLWNPATYCKCVKVSDKATQNFKRNAEAKTMNNFLLRDFAKEKVASMKDLLKAFDSSEGSGEEHDVVVIFTDPRKSRKSEEKSQLSTSESPAKSA